MSEDIYVPSEWGARFHALTTHEALGAGAAGPGKTTVLIHDPLAQVDIEHKRMSLEHGHPYRLERGGSVGWALHLRRTGATLDQTIAKTKREFPRIDPGAKWSESRLTWEFSSGYRYQFGHCKDPDDWENYMSNEYTHLAFDELTQFDKEQYDQISTRVRTSDRVLRRMLKIRSMSNPLMRRHKGETFRVKDQKWVQRYFVDPAPEGEKILVRTLRRRDGRLVKRTRIYLPATLYHNPDKGFVEDYEERLLTAPKHIQQALLYGNWDVTPDSFYADSWDPMVHVIEPFTPPKDWRFFRSMDWGFRQPGCVHWWAMNDDEELFIIEELTFQGKDAAQVAEDIKGIEVNLGLWDKKRKRSRITGIADTQLWEKRGDVGKGKAQTMREKGIFWRKAIKGAGSRQSNAERIVALLKSHEEHTRDPRLLISRKCRNLIRTLPGIQTDPHNANEPEDGGEDHWHDSLCYGVSFASRGIRGIPQPRDDDDDYEAETKSRNRGRYGYGQEVC